MNPELPTPGTLPPVGGPPPPPSEPHNPYGFILNAPKAPKKKLFKTGSLRSRLLLIVGIAAVVIAAIMIISSLLSRSSTALTTQLKGLVAEQQEVIRVSTLGLVSKDVALQTWAQTSRITVTSQQTALITYLSQRGIVLEPLELSTKLNKKTDATLAEATANSRYDEVYSGILTSTLTAYAQSLKESYQSVGNQATKALLSDDYNSVANILKK